MSVRKNKPLSKETMNDFIKKNHMTGNSMVKQTAAEQASIHAFKYTDEYMEQVTNYNSNLNQIDELYASVKPIHQILVRFYLHEPKRVGDLVLPFKQVVDTPTNAGPGKFSEIESDFPYTTKAIVIAAPDNNPLQKGDNVVLSNRAIKLRVIGNAANARIDVDGFVHPDAKLFEIPTDVTNKHYGYVLVDYHEIKAKV